MPPPSFVSCHRAHGRACVRLPVRGQLAKTDPIDVAIIARFGAQTKAGKLRLYQAPRTELETLRALRRRRDDLLTLKLAEQNRLMIQPCVVPSRPASSGHWISANAAIADRTGGRSSAREGRGVCAQRGTDAECRGAGPRTAATLTKAPDLRAEGACPGKRGFLFSGLASEMRARGVRPTRREPILLVVV